MNGNKGIFIQKTALVAVVTIALLSASVCHASPQKVVIHFQDSTLVSDTLILMENMGRIECDDPVLAAKVARTIAGEAAPPGYSRFINADDLVIFRLQPAFKNVQFSVIGQRRIKVASDFQEKNVGEFQEQIFSYVAENTGWEKGEWSLTIKNPQSSWKSHRGAVGVEVTGLNNLFSKGNVNVLLIIRQGIRVTRIPVSCHIRVIAPVLVSRTHIGRGERLDASSCSLMVMDITHFAHIPVREISEAGSRVVIRSVSPGTIIHEKLLRVVPTVSRGDQVFINFSNSAIKVSVLGTARESGGIGERIWVENLQTGKLIRAAVSGKGSVTVHQGGDNI